MKLDKFVAARIRNWNPTLNWQDREAILAAWQGGVAFDCWWSGKVVARTEAMRREGFVEVLSEDGRRYEWRKA